LVTPHGIDQPTTLDNCLRAHENEINFIHDISNGGIKHHCARDADCRQSLVSLEAEAAGPSFGHIDRNPLTSVRMEKSLGDNSRIRVGKYHRVILDESKHEFGYFRAKVDSR
jgi:hypothetical protein